jgi:sugar/nucleoside kinase (ribokinase family)
LYLGKGSRHEHIDAFERKEKDATGAGDVFGAAFLLKYYETRNAVESAIFASCAASFVVEKDGIEGVPHIEEVMERLKNESDHFSGW